MKGVKEILDKSDFRELVVSEDKPTREQFVKEFSTEINEFIDVVYEAYMIFKSALAQWKNVERNSYVEAYFHNAIDKLVISANLLISGYFVPSGNLVRQFCESLCMAILISSKRIDYFETFKRHIDNVIKFGGDDPEKLVMTNRSCYLVADHHENLGINKGGWEAFLNLRKLYNRLSHPSVFALSSIKDLSKGEGIRKFGAHFDFGKKGAYKEELRKRIDAAKYLSEIIKGIDQYAEKRIN